MNVYFRFQFNVGKLNMKKMKTHTHISQLICLYEVFRLRDRDREYEEKEY